jgi:iron complex outermembrane receptor protein
MGPQHRTSRTDECTEDHATARHIGWRQTAAATRSGLTVALAGLAIMAATAHAAETDLTDLDLSTLMDMDVNVTSVSKKQTRLADSAAAIAVITQDDIRRLGITSIPEALRLVPGLNVARMNANMWAISARGFNNQYANKLLVLVDGRSVYTPSFGGVYWNTQDMLLEELDRIEVIRGPGATLWGANAVNGVINITTKRAKDSQGVLLTSAVGTEEQPAAAIRYGGELTGNLSYRAFAKYVSAEGLVDSTGRDTPDDRDSVLVGFRADWERSSQEVLTLQGDYYASDEGEDAAVPMWTAPFITSIETENANAGANVLARWTRTVSEVSHWSMQAYVDHFRHEGALTVESRDTFDIELEHRRPLASVHDLMWGVGYRVTTDEFNETPIVVWTPASRDLHLYTAFVQDEITLIPGRLSATVGSKFEHNDYTGVEVQPSARLRWNPSEQHTLWGSLSRAVSTPARIHREARVNLATFEAFPFGPLIQAALVSSPDVDAETLNAYEIGYRVEPATNFSLDVTAFYNAYDRVAIPVPGETVFEASPGPPHLLIIQRWESAARGSTYGLELSSQWAATERWRLTAQYSLLKTEMGDVFIDQGSPQQQAGLRSYLQLPGNLELNTSAHFVDAIDTQFGAGTAHVDSYVRVDSGLLWRPRAELEAGVWARNLLDDRHLESTSFNTMLMTEVPRTVVARVTWRF